MTSIKKFSNMLDAVVELCNCRDMSLSNKQELKTLKREVYVVSNPELQSDWESLTDLTQEEYEMLVDILDNEA